MSLDFKPGCYSVKTGKTFLGSSGNDHDFYALQFNSALEPTMPSRKASLRQKKGSYFADWAWADKVLSYEGTRGKLQELECLLVYDKETHTFTLERPSVKVSMQKARKQKHSGSATTGNLPPSSSPNVKSAQAPKQPVSLKSSPILIATPPLVNKKSSPIGVTSVPIPLALPPVKQQPQKKQDTHKAPLVDSSNDSFDVDILSDMDEILNSEEDDDEPFETILPPIPSPQPIATSGKRRRRPALKMASAPIRRLDTSSPTTPAPTLLNRPHKPTTTNDDDSSSSSCSSDESGSSTDGSGDSTSDDDMDLLAANISRGLSEDTCFRPPSPRTGPRSLRDLLDGHHRDDDDVSSSESDDSL